MLQRCLFEVGLPLNAVDIILRTYADCEMTIQGQAPPSDPAHSHLLGPFPLSPFPLDPFPLRPVPLKALSRFALRCLGRSRLAHSHLASPA